MQPALGVPLDSAGVLSMIVAGGTVVASLSADRMLHRFGTGQMCIRDRLQGVPRLEKTIRILYDKRYIPHEIQACRKGECKEDHGSGDVYKRQCRTSTATASFGRMAISRCCTVQSPICCLLYTSRCV